MIRTRTCNESALAISTVCCSASVRPRAGCVHVEADAEPAEDHVGLAAHPAPVDHAARSRWVMKMFSATDRSGKMFGSW